jgi:hypothetical protein
MSPIIGIRYKSLPKDNYNLCANCEEKLFFSEDHSIYYPMVKMTNSSQHPKSINYTVSENVIYKHHNEEFTAAANDISNLSAVEEQGEEEGTYSPHNYHLDASNDTVDVDLMELEHQLETIAPPTEEEEEEEAVHPREQEELHPDPVITQEDHESLHEKSGETDPHSKSDPHSHPSHHHNNNNDHRNNHGHNNNTNQVVSSPRVWDGRPTAGKILFPFFFFLCFSLIPSFFFFLFLSYSGSSFMPAPILPDPKMKPPQHSWSTLDYRQFQVRIGPDYSRYKKKAPTAPPLYEPIGVDVFKTRSRLDHVAKRFVLPDTSQIQTHHPAVPPLFIIQLQIPSEPPPSFFSSTEDGPGWSVVMYYRITAETCEQLKHLTTTASPAVKLWANWCEKAPTDAAWRGRFKVSF